MTENSKPLLPWLYYAMIVLMVYAVGYQLKKNKKIYNEKMEHIEEAEETAEPHPMTSINESLYLPYAAAWHRIMDSEDNEFWLVCWDLDPAFVLNYHVYPENKLYMNVETQEDLHAKNLMYKKDPIQHVEPNTVYDKVIITNATSAEIKDTWSWQP